MASFSIQALTLLIDGTYSTVATTALVAYEFLITIQLEIDTVWRRPWTATSLLLLSTRWVMVLSAVLNLVPHSPAYVPRIN
ncbi:hypothetical protein PsYK624_007610 [Phanerochaete sordida]|uniref:DUF6533 domain-containing protein n=1 Tax=Phanerochaete sordida TaxID=48140 RepID=A0A9P3L792_9APHY|nr:hypothetical protein PsYK624_007610 [Phanerochaete sordida]